MGLANLGRDYPLWVGESQAVYFQEEESAADIFFMDQGKALVFPWV